MCFAQVHFLWFHIKDVIKSFETFERWNIWTFVKQNSFDSMMETDSEIIVKVFVGFIVHWLREMIYKN